MKPVPKGPDRGDERPRSGSDVPERIERIIAEVASGLGYMIYKAGVLYRGKNSKINVFLDHVNGISIADCEAFSRALNQRLEDEAVLPDYTLEVSSPGIRREIRTIDEWERFIGARIKAVCRTAEGNRVYRGTIVSVDRTRQTITLSVDGKEISYAFPDIVRSNLDY